MYSTVCLEQNENGIQAQEIWQLSQYLQDALYREQMLENKLANLQRLLSDSQAATDDNIQVSYLDFKFKFIYSHLFNNNKSKKEIKVGLTIH